MVLNRRGVVPALLGGLLVILAVLTVANAVGNAQKLHAATECQQQLNAELRGSLDARSDGADAVRAAQGNFIEALTHSGSAGLADPAVVAAMDHYGDALRRDAHNRAAHPIPQATSCQ